MVIGNIGIGNISTLATLNDHLGKKCFAFSSLDKSNIPDIPGKNMILSHQQRKICYTIRRKRKESQTEELK